MNRRPRTGTWMVVLLLAVAVPSLAPAPSLARSLLVERQLERQGFHFQVAFGWGGGNPGAGLFHNMEIGGTFRNGWTLAYNHVFIQQGGFYKREGAADLFGGHLLELKVPVLFDNVVAKVAAGLGGTHDQSNGIKAYLGFGWLYGLEIDFPLTRTSGLTVGLVGLHAVNSHHGHNYGGALSLGYTWF